MKSNGGSKIGMQNGHSILNFQTMTVAESVALVTNVNQKQYAFMCPLGLGHIHSFSNYASTSVLLSTRRFLKNNYFLRTIYNRLQNVPVNICSEDLNILYFLATCSNVNITTKKFEQMLHNPLFKMKKSVNKW